MVIFINMNMFEQNIWEIMKKLITSLDGTGFTARDHGTIVTYGKNARKNKFIAVYFVRRFLQKFLEIRALAAEKWELVAARGVNYLQNPTSLKSLLVARL